MLYTLPSGNIINLKTLIALEVNHDPLKVKFHYGEFFIEESFNTESEKEAFLLVIACMVADLSKEKKHE